MMVLLGTYTNTYAATVGGLWSTAAREWSGRNIGQPLKALGGLHASFPHAAMNGQRLLKEKPKRIERSNKRSDTNRIRRAAGLKPV